MTATPPPARRRADCRVCLDTGLMRWQQPVPTPDGGMELHEASHPCACAAARAAGTWRHPAAEAGRVVEVDHAAELDDADRPM